MSISVIRPFVVTLGFLLVAVGCSKNDSKRDFQSAAVEHAAARMSTPSHVIRKDYRIVRSDEVDGTVVNFDFYSNALLVESDANDLELVYGDAPRFFSVTVDKSTGNAITFETLAESTGVRSKN